MKKHISNFFAILLTGLFILYLVDVLVKSCDNFQKIELFVNIALGLFTGGSAIFLGYISYKQTKDANQLSELITRKEMKFYVSSIEKIKLNYEEIDKKVIEVADKFYLDGMYCSTSKMENCAEKIKFLHFSFYLKNKGVAAKSFQVQNVSLNGRLASSGSTVKFNKLNNNDNIYFTYDVFSKTYIVELYLHFNDLSKLQYINTNGLFVLEISCSFISVLGEETIYDCAFNMKKINGLPKLLDGSWKNIDINNCEITFF